MGEEGISKSARQGKATGPTRGLTYKDAGVDIEAGNQLVKALKPLAAATNRPGVISDLGGFGALFDPRAAGFQDPILVAATDGVGTKLNIAAALGKHDTVGIDLVAMCVNDLVVQGATPLFFLDYLSTPRLDPAVGETVIAGIAEGCRRAGCALIGGETAEHPGGDADGGYDLAGFAVGAAERGGILTGDTVTAGDTVLGLASDGLHSNGFSLVRRILEATAADLAAAAPFDRQAVLGDALLAPTRIYVRACLGALAGGGIKALAHITGGGLTENIPRVLPDGLGVRLDAATWTMPPVFIWLAAAGGVATAEMARTFNCGIGMAVIVDPDRADDAIGILQREGETANVIGKVVAVAAEGAQVEIAGLDGALTG